ncbi:hypothetical protein ACVCFZ_01100 [Acinetobacter variabilis]|uniref:hypothetical protein n=1 Tax=Acinetobacter variabilis TaxID=70346 RepID=UPI0035D411E7
MATVECLVCGHVGSTKTKGSFAITLILLWFAILPGIIYEVWRRSGGKVCSACGSHSVRLYTPVNRVVVQPASQSTTVEPTKNYGKSKLVANDTFSYSAGERLNQENQGENPEFKDCPFCAEKIKLAAIKCKHCGSMVEE